MEAAITLENDPRQRVCEHCGGNVRFIVKFRWWRCFGCGRRWGYDSPHQAMSDIRLDV